MLKKPSIFEKILTVLLGYILIPLVLCIPFYFSIYNLTFLNAFFESSAAIMRLQNFNDRFIYVVKYLDKDISKYLTESQEAINFYYTVEEKRTGIKVSFAIIYIIIV